MKDINDTNPTGDKKMGGKKIIEKIGVYAFIVLSLIIIYPLYNLFKRHQSKHKQHKRNGSAPLYTRSGFHQRKTSFLLYKHNQSFTNHRLIKGLKFSFKHRSKDDSHEIYSTLQANEDKIHRGLSILGSMNTRIKTSAYHKIQHFAIHKKYTQDLSKSFELHNKSMHEESEEKKNGNLNNEYNNNKGIHKLKSLHLSILSKIIAKRTHSYSIQLFSSLKKINKKAISKLNKGNEIKTTRSENDKITKFEEFIKFQKFHHLRKFHFPKRLLKRRKSASDSESPREENEFKFRRKPKSDNIASQIQKPPPPLFMDFIQPENVNDSFLKNRRLINLCKIIMFVLSRKQVHYKLSFWVNLREYAGTKAKLPFGQSLDFSANIYSPETLQSYFEKKVKESKQIQKKESAHFVPKMLNFSPTSLEESDGQSLSAEHSKDEAEEEYSEQEHCEIIEPLELEDEDYENIPSHIITSKEKTIKTTLSNVEEAKISIQKQAEAELSQNMEDAKDLNTPFQKEEGEKRIETDSPKILSPGVSEGEYYDIKLERSLEEMYDLNKDFKGIKADLEKLSDQVKESSTIWKNYEDSAQQTTSASTPLKSSVISKQGGVKSERPVSDQHERRKSFF